jgi:flagellar hook protein FlgE
LAPYGADITDPIPYPLSNPQSAVQYTSTNEAYDVAINGQPYFLMSSDDSPYRRVTAQYRKQQYDQTREAGEQSLTGWWFRSQSSFHLGQGIKFFEPAQDESLRFQYTESKGLDVWTRGQATLILDTDATHQTTGTLNANLRPQQHLRSIQWEQLKNTGATTYNEYLGCLLLDGYDIDKIYPTISATVTNKALTSNVATLTTSAAHGLAVGMEIVVAGVDATFNGTYTIATVPTTTTLTYAKTAADVPSAAATGTITSVVQHFVDYNSGADDKVYAMCDDGVNCYWVTNVTSGGVTKLTMYKKPLTGYSTDSPTTTVKMFDTTGIIVTNAVMEFTKERIVACINNKVYEISTTATALPTAVYTHPVDNFVYTSITSSGAAIYVTGFSGTQSNIQKFTLASNGTMPTLTSAITAAEMPSGERIYKIAYYLGYMMIGTTKGIRAAAVSDDGSLAYGPLIWENTQPVYDFAFRDRFAWAATSVEDEPGTIRLDLSTQISPLVFPYAYDTYKATGSTAHETTACAFINGTERLAFTTNAITGTNGSVYIESDTRLVESGYLQTGYVRYNTLEAKIFKLLQARVDTTNGGLVIKSIDNVGTEYSIGSFTQGQDVPEVTISYPALPQEYLGFSFTLSRSTSDNTKGPVFTGYQLKSLPSVPRQRLIQYPLACFDRESDKFGVEVGYEGRAYDRMSELESIESNGDTIRIDDFRTGESFIGIIEELDFINRTPSDKRFSGFGGLLICTIRSV